MSLSPAESKVLALALVAERLDGPWLTHEFVPVLTEAEFDTVLRAAEREAESVRFRRDSLSLMFNIDWVKLVDDVS